MAGREYVSRFNLIVDPEEQRRRDAVAQGIVLDELQTAQDAGDTRSAGFLQQELSNRFRGAAPERPMFSEAPEPKTGDQSSGGWRVVDAGWSKSNAAPAWRDVSDQYSYVGQRQASSGPDESFTGSFSRGIKKTIPELQQAGAGVVAYLGDVFGAEGVKEWGLDKYQKIEQETKPLQAESDSFSSTFLDGKGSKTAWLGNAVGYTLGQVGTALISGGIGALAGKTIVKKAITEGMERTISATLEGELARGVARDAAEAAAIKAGQEYAAGATVAAMKAGGVTGAFAHNITQELGSIYNDAVDQAKKDGRELDGGDLMRIGSSALAAAGVDTAMEAVNFTKLTKGGIGDTFKGRLAREVPTGMLREGATEAVQTGIEQYGAGKPLDTREIVDSAALGAVGGGMAGAGASVRQRTASQAATPQEAVSLPVTPVVKPDEILSLPSPTMPATNGVMVAQPDGTVRPQTYGEATAAEQARVARDQRAAEAAQLGLGEAQRIQQGVQTRNDAAMAEAAEEYDRIKADDAFQRQENQQLSGSTQAVKGVQQSFDNSRLSQESLSTPEQQAVTPVEPLAKIEEPAQNPVTLRKDGSPFSTLQAAQTSIKARGLDAVAVSVKGGYGIQARVSTPVSAPVSTPAAIQSEPANVGNSDTQVRESFQQVIARRLRRVADDVEKHGTNNGARALDERWAHGAITRTMAADGVAAMLKEKAYGSVAAAQIALGKPGLTPTKLRAIADKLVAKDEPQLRQANDGTAAVASGAVPAGTTPAGRTGVAGATQPRGAGVAKKPKKEPSLIAAIKSAGGLRAEFARDLVGDRAHLANRMYPGTFRKNGIDLSSMIHDGTLDDYLPPHLRRDVNGDVDEAQQYIADAIRDGTASKLRSWETQEAIAQDAMTERQLQALQDEFADEFTLQELEHELAIISTTNSELNEVADAEERLIADQEANASREAAQTQPEDSGGDSGRGNREAQGEGSRPTLGPDTVASAVADSSGKAQSAADAKAGEGGTAEKEPITSAVDDKRSAEEKIRDAANAAIRTIGSWHPISVTHTGKTQNFLANQKSIDSKGRGSVIHLARVVHQRLVKGIGEPEPVFHGYKLGRDNQLVEEGILRPASKAEVSRWESAFGSLTPRPALELTGQTEGQIRADEAAQAKQRADQKARDNAPSPDDFTLTGSDRAADVGAAHGQNSLFEPQSEYGQRDLFADQVPDAQRANLVERVGSARPDGINATAAVNRAEQRSLPGKYSTGVVLRPGVTREAGVSSVNSLADAALATSSLSELVREHIDVLVTGAGGKILAVQRMFAGATSQTSAYPGEIVRFVTAIKGAEAFYISHNHPSGESALSSADLNLSNAIGRLASNIAPSYRGIIAVTNRGYSAYSVDGETESGSFPEKRQNHKIKYLEETIERAGYLGPRINSPELAASAVKEISEGQEGVVFLDAQLRPTGFFPVKMDAATKLSGTELARDIIAASYRSRSTAAIIATQHGRVQIDRNATSDASDGARNIGTLLSKIEVQVVDIVDANGRSASNAGERTSNGTLFNRTAEPAASQFDQLLYDGIGQGKTVNDTLDAIRKASPNKFNRAVARALIQAGLETTIQHGEAKGLKFAVKDRNAESFAAAYKPKTDTVMLFTPANAERNVLHELMHAATYQAVRGKTLAAGQLKALFRHVKKSGQLDGMYGMENVDEFIAEAFSNPKFQAKLREVSAANLGNGSLKSAFDWFVRVVRQILGLGKIDENALSQAISLGAKLMDEQMAATGAKRAAVGGGTNAVMATKDVVGNNSESPAGDNSKGDPRYRLVDTEGMTAEQARQAVQSRAEQLASELRDGGFKVELQHSGSASGPSSYLSVSDPQTGRFFINQIRISNHSKGAFNSGGVWAVATDEQMREVVDKANEMRAQGPTAIRQQEIDGEKKALQETLARANKKLSQGKSLTRTEQEAINRSTDSTAPDSGGAKFSRADTIEVDGKQRSRLNSDGKPIYPTEEGIRNFWRWFGDSKVVDDQGRPLVVYHGTTATDISEFRPDGGKDGLWQKALDHFKKAQQANERYGYMNFRSGSFFSPKPEYANNYTGENSGAMYPSYIRAENPVYHDQKTKSSSGINPDKTMDALILHVGGDINEVSVIDPAQVKSATGNTGAFNPANDSILGNIKDSDLFTSRNESQTDYDSAEASHNLGSTVKELTAKAMNVARDRRGTFLQFLGRRQILDIYGKDVPELARYNDLIAKMEASQNDASQQADSVVQDWRKLNAKRPDVSRAMAELMHDATLAGFDPDTAGKADPNAPQFPESADLRKRWANLPDEAKAIYRAARDNYREHFEKVKAALEDRVQRSGLDEKAKTRMLAQMRADFTKAAQGVYFPLARFGEYMVVVRGENGKTEAVSFAETQNQAAELRAELIRKYPDSTVSAVQKRKEFSAERDGVSAGFMKDLVAVINEETSPDARDSLLDSVNQLYLSSLPDLSWAKSGIHRKGTPGYSNDAMRAFARNMFHGGYYLAKLNYGDQLQDSLTAMQDGIDDKVKADPEFSNIVAQNVVDEMVKRHKLVMNPNNNPVANMLTGLGFIFHMGLSPASAAVNLSQTALVAYPMLGAKFGFGKSMTALLKASGEAVKGKNDLLGQLSGDEKAAFDQAVRDGVIDLTMAHDLAGVSQGRAGTYNEKTDRVFRVASVMFHEAEKFNRGVTFLAAYRLAKDAGASNDAAIKSAADLTYAGHFDYSANNRARIMQGPYARVLLLFKQYGQNMIYTLMRNTQQAFKGDREAQRTLAGLLAMHGMFAGALGLPLVTSLLAAASAVGGSDDEPWDAQIALRNYLADVFGKDLGEVLAHGIFRAPGIKDVIGGDISGRVGLDSMLFRAPQDTLQGDKYAQAMLATIAGPVFGIPLNLSKGALTMAEGDLMRGIEEMMPKAIKDQLKAFRYEREGIVDKSRITLVDNTTVPEEVAQALGFSPARGMEAYEGKAAIKEAETKLNQRRKELLNRYSRAREDGDADAVSDVREMISRWNRTNPTMAITGDTLLKSMQNRAKRQAEAENGAYLAKNKRGLATLGEFANVE